MAGIFDTGVFDVGIFDYQSFLKTPAEFSQTAVAALPAATWATVPPSSATVVALKSIAVATIPKNTAQAVLTYDNNG